MLTRLANTAPLPVALVVLAATIPFASTIHGYFIWDDFAYVALFAGRPALYFLKHFATSLSEGVWGYTTDEVRPFLALSLQVGALGGADSPVLQHLINIALHAATSVMVAVMTRVMGRTSWVAAGAAGAAFALMPAHAEPVIWITGRVESIMAVFYGGAVLAYAGWRQHGGRGRFVMSLVLSVAALYGKQPALTLCATLFTYEWLVHRHDSSDWRARVRPLLPHVALLAAMVVLRLALFGSVVREESIAGLSTALEYFRMQGRYVQYLAVGYVRVGPGLSFTVQALVGLAALTMMAAATLLFERLTRIASPTPWRQRCGAWLFFGPAWWVVTTAPLLVAGYESARFLYLPTFGLCIAAGLVFDPLVRRAGRPAVLALTAVLLVLEQSALSAGVTEWNRMGRLSRQIQQAIVQEEPRWPRGTLLVLDVPESPVVWGAAAPFALRPPFSPRDLNAHFRVVSRQPASYYSETAWFADMQTRLQEWVSRPGAPVVVMTWATGTGALSRRTEQGSPGLNALAADAAASPSGEELTRRLQKLVNAP